MTSSFPICIPLIFFSFLTDQAKMSRTILNRFGESELAFVCPDFSGSALTFSPFELIFTLSLLWTAFIVLRYGSSFLPWTSYHWVESFSDSMMWVFCQFCCYWRPTLVHDNQRGWMNFFNFFFLSFETCFVTDHMIYFPECNMRWLGEMF